MGSYTTNYQLYMPSVGEQGWGDLVNANFTNLDTILKSGAGIRAAQADKLTTARTINGTSFNGTANITTTNWGTARSFSITDGTNTGTVSSVNGSGNISLRLPTTIEGMTIDAPNIEYEGIGAISPLASLTATVAIPYQNVYNLNIPTKIGYNQYAGRINGNVNVNHAYGIEIFYLYDGNYTVISTKASGTSVPVDANIPYNVDIYAIRYDGYGFTFNASTLTVTKSPIAWYQI